MIDPADIFNCLLFLVVVVVIGKIFVELLDRLGNEICKIINKLGNI